MTVEHDRLWVACTVDNRLLVLDTHTLRVLDRLDTPEAPDAVVLAPDGDVLAVSQAGPTVVRFDTRTLEPVGRKALGHADQLYDRANIDATVVDGKLWATSYDDGMLLRAPAP
jgi:DNA-binding beta-propeller fold protein YncE